MGGWVQVSRQGLGREREWSVVNVEQTIKAKKLKRPALQRVCWYSCPVKKYSLSMYLHMLLLPRSTLIGERLHVHVQIHVHPLPIFGTSRGLKGTTKLGDLLHNYTLIIS